MEHAVVQSAEALHYKRKVSGSTPDGVTGPVVNSASNRSEYQEYFLQEGGKGGRWVGMTTLPPSCTACHEIWRPHGLSRPVMRLLYHLLY